MIALLIVFVTGANNYATIWEGYASNASVQRINNAKLESAREEYRNGKKIDSIVLYKLPYDQHTSTQPYHQPEATWIVESILRYYELPITINVVYQDFPTEEKLE